MQRAFVQAKQHDRKRTSYARGSLFVKALRKEWPTLAYKPTLKRLKIPRHPTGVMEVYNAIRNAINWQTMDETPINVYAVASAIYSLMTEERLDKDTAKRLDEERLNLQPHFRRTIPCTSYPDDAQSVRDLLYDDN